jgi:hypothetical protein
MKILENFTRNRIFVLDVIFVFAAAIVVTVSDPFAEGNDFEGLGLFVWWLLLVTVAYSIGEGFARKGTAALRGRWHPAVQTILLTVCAAVTITATLTVIVGVMQYLIGLELMLGRLAAEIFGTACVVGSVRIGASLIMAGGRSSEREEERSVPDIFSHIPRAIGFELVMMRSEDHYLRFETAKGHHLKKYKFSDAVKELGDLQGVVVRRGTWVSLDHISAIKSLDGQLIIELSNGSEALVSRANRKQVKSALFDLGLSDVA